MSEHREVTTPYGTVSKVSWGAVIAGTMITLVNRNNDLVDTQHGNCTFWGRS